MIRDEIYKTLDEMKKTENLRSFSDAIEGVIKKSRSLEQELKLKDEELKRHDKIVKLAEEILYNQSK